MNETKNSGGGAVATIFAIMLLMAIGFWPFMAFENIGPAWQWTTWLWWVTLLISSSWFCILRVMRRRREREERFWRIQEQYMRPIEPLERSEPLSIPSNGVFRDDTLFENAPENSAQFREHQKWLNQQKRSSSPSPFDD